MAEYTRSYCISKGYKSLKEVKELIYNQYHIKVCARTIYNLQPITYKCVGRGIYIEDWQRIIDYYKLPKAERKKNYCLKTYGVENPMQSEEIKNKNLINKRKFESVNTLAKYFKRDSSSIKRIIKYLGIEPIDPSKSLKYYDNSVKEQISNFIKEHPNTKTFLYLETCRKTYGVDNISKIPEIKQKKVDTLLKNYGVKNYSQLESVRKDLSKRSKENAERRNKNRKKTVQKAIEVFEKENDCISLMKLNKQKNFGYDKCGRFSELIYKLGIPYLVYQNNLFIYNKDIEKIYEYKDLSRDKQTSFFEREILEYIYSIYKGEITDRNRSIIAPKELDIFIPEKKVAIEFNGLYWHSEIFVEKDYHFNKTQECNKKGIRLLHIFEDEWIFKKDICKSLIASALGVYKEKIYARECIIKSISSSIAKEFLNQNHIQGYIKSKYNFGLFYNDNLIQVISIGQSRFKKDETELLRMATLLNTQVIGGFSKLLNYAMKYLSISELYSYIDKRLFNGKGYESCGFKKISESKPSYFYIKGMKRENRMKYQKHKLKNLFENFDENLTEKENMLNNGYHLIYDSGTIKVRLDKNIDMV